MSSWFHQRLTRIFTLGLADVRIECILRVHGFQGVHGARRSLRHAMTAQDLAALFGSEDVRSLRDVWSVRIECRALSDVVSERWDYVCSWWTATATFLKQFASTHRPRMDMEISVVDLDDATLCASATSSSSAFRLLWKGVWLRHAHARRVFSSAVEILDRHSCVSYFEFEDTLKTLNTPETLNTNTPETLQREQLESQKYDCIPDGLTRDDIDAAYALERFVYSGDAQETHFGRLPADVINVIFKMTTPAHVLLI